jgi:hypothetical protein
MKKSGRPRLDEHDDSVAICVRVPAHEYDALYQRSQRDRCSVPEVIRRDVAAASGQAPRPRGSRLD